jgi:hypothetical protein
MLLVNAKNTLAQGSSSNVRYDAPLGERRGETNCAAKAAKACQY